MPGMGSSKRQKPRTITRGFCLMSAGTTHLDPQGWALRAVHNHNPHGKLLVPELGVGCRNGTTLVMTAPPRFGSHRSWTSRGNSPGLIASALLGAAKDKC